MNYVIEKSIPNQELVVAVAVVSPLPYCFSCTYYDRCTTHTYVNSL